MPTTSKVSKEAKEAFTKSFRSANVADGNQVLVSVVGLFLETLKEINPDAQFTSTNIKLWAEEYVKGSPKQDLEGWEAINSYAIGKFLKNNMDGDLKYTQVGSYGNRAIYSLIEEKERDKS